MKILLVWPDNEPEVKIIIDALIEGGHEIPYWVGLIGGEHYAPKGTVFHDHYAAWEGKPAEGFATLSNPPSAALIERSYRTESFTLSMMDKRFDSAPLEERKQIYYSMLGYWNSVFDSLQPEAVVFNVVPHTVYNYVMYEIARERGIPTISSEDVWFVGRIIQYKDFWKGSDELRSALTKRISEKVTVADLGPDFRKYWDRQVAKPEELPWYMREQKKVGEGFGIWKHRAGIFVRTLKNGTLMSTTFAFVTRRMRRGLRGEYEAHSTSAGMQKPFVYFPLNFQPERTSSPQAGVYNEQILAIETLATALPEGWEVYVKEHPSQWLMRSKTQYSSVRYPGYYRRIASISNVRLVPITADSFMLTEKAQAVATVGGTVGWEALLRGQAPLVFGIPWYRDCPGVIQVSSVNECRAAFDAITRMQVFKPNEHSMIAYLKALEDVTIRAYQQVHLSDIGPVISKRESSRAIAEAMLRDLKSARA